MSEAERLVSDEIAATLDRAGFEELSPEAFRVEIADSFQRKLGECRPSEQNDEDSAPNLFHIRIASRLFDDESGPDWRDVVRHEVAHAHVLSRFGRNAQPHGEEWQDAARQAGADPSARYEVDDFVDAKYVLACPNGCFERGYLKRSKRIQRPWKYACKDCETALVSYDVDTVPSSPEPGTCLVESIQWETKADLESGDGTHDAPYQLACPDGCCVWPYQKRSKRIKNPWRYACPECNTLLVSCDGDESPTEFDPGTCHVTGIPVTEPFVIHACPNGCFSRGHLQQSTETRHPDQFRCEDCGTTTISYPTGQRPSDPTPGKNYTN